jgi:hypothetical protein
MSTLVKNSFMPGRYNNYLIGGNLCNAFALGEIGSLEEFFIVGAEPSDESNYPMITANILDSEGNVLFRLVKNVLVFNPGHCSKILGDHIGYEIHDSEGNMVFKISTKFEKSSFLNEEGYITTIEANFFDRRGSLIFHAEGGCGKEHIETHCKSAFGFSGGFGFVMGYTEEEVEMVRIALQTEGNINQKISGIHEGEVVLLDGKLLHNAILRNCDIIIKEGDFLIGSGCEISSCRFEFQDKAKKIFDLAIQLKVQKETH